MIQLASGYYCEAVIFERYLPKLDVAYRCVWLENASLIWYYVCIP